MPLDGGLMSYALLAGEAFNGDPAVVFDQKLCLPNKDFDSPCLGTVGSGDWMQARCLSVTLRMRSARGRGRATSIRHAVGAENSSPGRAGHCQVTSSRVQWPNEHADHPTAIV